MYKKHLGKGLLSLSLLLIPTALLAAPKNIIYMIGDGMGPVYLSGYRYYSDDLSTKTVESTIYDQLWLGMASSYPDDDTYVTDSAAGATALAAGIKSYNGAISVDHNHIPLSTMMMQAKKLGKMNGIVASSQINHATPAAFLAHNKSRSNYNEIANMYVDYKINGKPVADVMLGGGQKYFIRDDRNLINELKQLDYQYADNWQQLDKLTRMPAIALLADVALPSALDNPVQQPLAQLTTKALQLLSPAEKGFVLMVEGSQIDWCGHSNDIACAMAEMDDFAKAIQVAKDFVDANPDTLLIITADHETGGLSLGANGVYEWRTDLIKKIRNTALIIAQKMLAESDDKNTLKIWQDLTAMELSSKESALLLSAKVDGNKALTKQIKAIINTKTHTGWTTSGHTAIDIPVLAYGKWKDDFIGFQDNTDIAKKIMHYIEQTK
ncbi:alkaline phosphatase [Rheinheimera sp. MMS21-TC3]|uniref:alkaline phosphatase n=1 Tax=Rheinheimera sp. MMS21-TC3 TaxID=3072790 RepID=UPI0028C502BC|nr:alkaline phosphatase [Rheinheimera sp. MMS21-TC3]WNO61363.1 alkaline phosphatase [Rheinheimera sp. MMS21-TC3]